MSNGDEHALLVRPEDMDKSTDWENFTEYKIGNIKCKCIGTVTINKKQIVSYRTEEALLSYE